MHNYKKEFGVKSIVAYIMQIVAQIMSMFLVIVITRTLGAAEYGKLVYATSIINLLVVLVGCGLSKSVVAYVSRMDISEASKRGIVLFDVVFEVVFAIIVSAIVISNRIKLQVLIGKIEISDTLFAAIIPFLVFESILGIITGVLKGKKDVTRYYCVEKLVPTVVKLILVIVIYYLFKKSGIWTLVLIFYISYLINVLYGIFCLGRYGFFKDGIEKVSYISNMRFSIPFMFVGMMNTLNTNVDHYFLGFFATSTAVAVYSVANNIVNFSVFAENATNHILAPIISEVYSLGNIGEVIKIYKFAAKWCLAFNLFVFGYVCVWGNEILSIFGKEYANGKMLLLILFIGQIVDVSVGSVGVINSMTGHPQHNFWATLVAVCANILLNLCLIKSCGEIGVAIASAISVALKNVLNISLMQKHIKMIPFGIFHIYEIIVLLCGVILIIYIKRLLLCSITVSMLLSGVVYTLLWCIAMYVCGLDDNEKRYVKAIKYKFLPK